MSGQAAPALSAEQLIDAVLASTNDEEVRQYGALAIEYLLAPGTVGDPEETLSANDDRMNQVVFENGNLWAGVNTVVGGVSTPLRSGIAWFAI